MSLTQTVTWIPYPQSKPESIDADQYKRYLVATCYGQVFVCSWLIDGWHKRHDGSGDITKSVVYWMDVPLPPNENTQFLLASTA